MFLLLFFLGDVTPEQVVEEVQGKMHFVNK